MKIPQKIVGFAVAKPTDAKPVETPTVPASSFVNDNDRRMVLSESNGPTPELQLERRPASDIGHEGKTYCIKAPADKVYVTVNHVNGNPFEVFIRAKHSRGLESIAQSLSMDLRTGDRKFIRRKLDAIGKVCDTPFDFGMPDGMTYRMSGVMSCIARLILYRCEELWDQSESQTTHLSDALTVKREPKTTPDGTLSWTVDVCNNATGDDFKLFLAEATDGGKTRPYSVWIDGDFADETYRNTLRGTCKSLSIDLQVGPLGWVGKKLQQLQEYAEPRAEFRVRVPGSEKTALYPSTEAYIADLILHRLHGLGLLNRDGRSLTATTPQLVLVAGEQTGPRGAHCGECGAYAVHVVSGCPTCAQCGASKCS